MEEKWFLGLDTLHSDQNVTSDSDLQIYVRIEDKQLRFNAELEFINLKLIMLLTVAILFLVT